nr:hypothetical protein [Bradyrhizobium diazoefficiens]
MKSVNSQSRGPARSIVLFGKNRFGNWVARERSGIFGGLFVNRAQALRYALFKSGYRPDTIVEVSRKIELDTFAYPERRKVRDLMRRQNCASSGG